MCTATPHQSREIPALRYSDCPLSLCHRDRHGDNHTSELIPETNGVIGVIVRIWLVIGRGFAFDGVSSPIGSLTQVLVGESYQETPD